MLTQRTAWRPYRVTSSSENDAVCVEHQQLLGKTVKDVVGDMLHSPKLHTPVSLSTDLGDLPSDTTSKHHQS
jgi:hypothetical protein